MSKLLTTVVMCLIFCRDGTSQFRNDLETIKKVYYGYDTQIVFNYNYTYFYDLDLKEVLDSLKGDYVMANGNFMFNAGKYSIYKNDKYFIRVNPYEKSITVHDPSKNINADMISNLDSLFKSENVEVKEIVSSNSKAKTYRLIQPFGVMSDSIDFTFNKTTFLIEKFIVYMKYNIYDDNYNLDEIKKPVLVGEFYGHRVTKLTEQSKDLFKNTPYIKVNNGRMMLTDKYRSYSLSNYLN